MKRAIGVALEERVVDTYGRVRACTDDFIEFRGSHIENHHPNRRAIAVMLGAHRTELERFLRLNGKEPDLCEYYCIIRDLHAQAERKEFVEVPDLPSFAELLAAP